LEATESELPRRQLVTVPEAEEKLEDQRKKVFKQF
jgi:hypothetical protein